MPTPNPDYQLVTDGLKATISVGINNQTANYLNFQQIVKDAVAGAPPVVGDLVGCDVNGNLLFEPWAEALWTDSRFQWTVNGDCATIRPAWPDLTKQFSFKLNAAKPSVP